MNEPLEWRELRRTSRPPWSDPMSRLDTGDSRATSVRWDSAKINIHLFSFFWQSEKILQNWINIILFFIEQECIEIIYCQYYPAIWGVISNTLPLWKKLHTSHSQMLGKVESGGGPIFKVVLECLKRCSEPFLIYIYGIQCDFMPKSCWKHSIAKFAM